MGLQHVKIIIRVFTGRVGVAASAVLLQFLSVVVFVREIFGAQEKHVFKKMSNPRNVVGVGKMPYVDIERSRGFVGGGVGDQGHDEAIREGDRSVLAVVVGRNLHIWLLKEVGSAVAVRRGC